MTFRRIETGRMGEKIALAFLKKLGYSILEKNYRTRFGEIDIIALDRGVTAFIEVRSRGKAFFCAPEESITKKKQRQISMSALCYIKKMGLQKRACRFDVVLIDNVRGASVAPRLIRDAFLLEERFRY